MAPTIGRLALDNGFHGSIPGDWVAPPPQNIQHGQDGKEELSKVYENSIYPYYNKQTRMIQEYACFFFAIFI